MTTQPHDKAFLRQVSPSTATGSAHTRYPLSTSQSIVIGRDPNSCQIVLDSAHYQGVSRHHAEIRPIQGTGGSSLWQVCDLGSANGTYVNHQRVQGCQTLQAGDLISLGKQGADFIFEYQSSIPVHHARPLNIQPSDSLHLSQVLPVFSMRRDLRWKKLMIPGAIAVLFVVLMFDAIQSDPLRFMYLLGIFLAMAGYYLIYQLCGKSKPWWLIVGVVLATILFNFTFFGVFAFFFRQVLPGNVSELMQMQEQGASVNSLDFLVRMFFGAGLLEELTKALPVFALLFVGLKLKSPWRERIGVWEPLDGILLGTASAVGFTLQETLGEYVPRIMQQAMEGAGEGVALYFGLALLIPRIVGAIAGHMAYSGYFGYFIGLSVLKPRRRWQLLAIGYLTAATIHALWNSVEVFGPNAFIDTLLQAAAGILAFAFLIAAILKARQLSPTRSQNFATQYRPPNSP
jgi:RsiW-degrading membrane proteinase PrsW (M82 family)